MQTSITTMTAALIPSGILKTIKHNKYNHIDWTIFKWSAPLICLGSIIVCLIMTKLPSQIMIIMYIFSLATLVLVFRATYKFFSKKEQNLVNISEVSLVFKYV